MVENTGSLIKIRQAGIEALREKLGLSGMIRFLQQFETGRRDYTADRHRWLEGIEVSDIRAQLHHLRLERDQPPTRPASDALD